MRKETEVLAETLDFTRQLTKFYLSHLKGKDPYVVFKSENGQPLNSAFWVIAHLTVTENWLVLYSTHGETERIPWGKLFGMGTSPPSKEDSPTFEEVLQKFKEVHPKCLDHIRSLSEEDLDKPTKTGATFGGEDTCRSIIKHAIRHEGYHAGHLGWLCKLHGVPTH